MFTLLRPRTGALRFCRASHRLLSSLQLLAFGRSRALPNFIASCKILKTTPYGLMKGKTTIMKTKMLLLAALVSAAALSANAGVRFGLSFGWPVAVAVPAPVVVAAPVVAAAPPVIVALPVAPPPVVVAVPPCPGVDYVWAPGYWACRPGGRVWIAGAWCHRPMYAARGDFHGGRRW
jgi:hypothetical protein